MHRKGLQAVAWRAHLLTALALGFAVALAVALDARSADSTAPTTARATLPEKELVEYRTERSKTFEVPGRGAMTRFYGQPVHYDSGKKGLQPIRNTLVPSSLPGYAVRNQANAFRADLPERLSDPVRFGGDGHWVRFGLRGASARAAVAGGGVRYDNALEATDVEYELRPTGLKETLVLKSRAAAAPAVFDVDISHGLEPEVRSDGSIAFRDGDKSVFGFAAPFMLDADGAYSSEVSVELARVGDAWRLTLSPSSAWLDDPAREFPVRLDPTVIWGWPYSKLIDAPADTFVSAAAPTTNYGPSAVNDVGASGTATRRALLRYQVTEPLPWDRRVYSARFAAFAEWKDGTVGAPVTARPLTAAFTEWAATWNNRDAGLAWAAPGGDFTADAGAPAPRQTIQVTNQWYFWDFRQMTDDWLSRRRAEHGFMLRGDEVAGTTPSTIFHFSSAETPDQSREPYLDVFSERMVGAREVDSFVELTPTGVESMYGTTPATAPAVSVNPATGNLLVHTNDAPAGTEDPISLLLDRFYNSGTASSTNRFGKGWSPGLDGFYLQADTVEGNVVFWGPSDEAYAFTRRPDGTFAPIDAADSAATLVREASGNYVIALAGQRFVFPCLDCGATTYVDASGATATLNYEGQQRAQTIQTSAGTTRLKDTAAGLAYEAVTPTGAVHRYEYTSDNRLSRHTAPGNVVTTYGYDANGRLNEIRQPNGQILRFTYAWTLGGWRVETMTWVTDPATGAGKTTAFAYSFDTTSCPAVSVVRTVQTRPDGRTITYCVDSNREVVGSSDATQGGLGRAGQRLELAAEISGHELNVNLSGGGLLVVHPDVDAFVGEEDGGISLQRMYSSHPGRGGELGDGWEFDAGAGTRLRALTDGTRTVALRGSVFEFKSKPDGTFESPPEYSGVLRRQADETFSLSDDATTSTYRFPAGTDVRLASVTDSHGLRNDYSYGTDTFGITNSGGVSTTTAASNGRITGLTEPAGTHRYEYSHGRLSAYVPPGAAEPTIRYEYDGQGRLRTLRASNGDVATVSYDAQGRVGGLTHTAGTTTKSTTFTYFGPDAPCVAGRDAMRVLVIRGGSPADTFCFDASGRLTYQTASAGGEEPHEDGGQEIEYETDMGAPPDGLTPSPDMEPDCQPYADSTDPDATKYCGEAAASNPLYEDGSDGTIGGLAFGTAPASPDLMKGGIGWGLSAQNLHVDMNPRNDLSDVVDDSQEFRNLKLRKVRFITPWDTVWRATTDRRYPDTTNSSDPLQGNYAACAVAGTPRDTWCADRREQDILDAWLHAVTRGCNGQGTADDVHPCYQPMISFSSPRFYKALRSYLPSPSEYRDAIHAFRERYPNVEFFTAWNEPNDPAQPTNFRRAFKKYSDGKRGPIRAGQYYLEMRALCDVPPPGLKQCYPAAGDFADNGTLTNEYIQLYKKGMQMPLWSAPSWAYHAYLAGRFKTLDGRRHQLKLQAAFNFRSFIQSTAVPQAVRDRDEAQGKPPTRHPRIWLTEQGGMVHRFRADGMSVKKSERAARSSVRFLLGEALQTSYRVNRFYYYAWDGDKYTPARDTFDSGLRSPYTNLIRPVYADFKSYVNP